MKISHQWLQTYVSIRLSPRSLAEGLSMLGLEIEHVEDLAQRYEGFKVGEVLSVEKHPQADKLTVCRVSVGTETLQIVCGAPNVAAGQKVPVGLAGATVPKDQHDAHGAPFVLRKVKIRGVESQGMICSAYELDLGEDRDGILVLDKSARPGTALSKALGATDVIYDLEVTANRGDWLSHIGVAREVAAMTGRKAVLPKVKIREGKEPVSRFARVTIQDRKGCGRYVAAVCRNVTIGPSPEWLQRRLRSVGIRPINNVVDITNFVMLETGQPLHAFDYDLLAGHAIVVRNAKDGEKFVTLDGKERTLRRGTLLICDAERPVAIAGVMGGQNSEISDSTKNVLLESAWFEPSSIRKTSKYLGLSTDASQRFERSVDIETSLYAARRASQLFQELIGAEVLKGVLDVYPGRTPPHNIKARISRINSVLGTALTKQNVISHLRKLGIKTKGGSGNSVMAVIPTFRNDLTAEVDLVEEVARMYGYDKIGIESEARISPPAEAAPDIEDPIRDFLIGGGFNEIITNSLQNRIHATLLPLRPVEVLNPVSVEMQMLRTSLIPGALDVVQHNFNRGAKGLRMFEIGKVFWREEGSDAESLHGYREERRLLVVLTGLHFNQHYSVPQRTYDIFDLKGELEALASKFFLDKHRLIYYDNAKPLSVDNIHVEIQGTYAGFLGTLRKEIAARFGIEEAVFVAELSLDVLSGAWDQNKRFKAIPRFPNVTRDLAFVVSDNLPQAMVEDAIREAGGALLSNIVLFDLYSGEQVGEGKKSVAYTLEFQPVDRTLTDEEVNQIVSGIIDHVQRKCGASLRT